MGKNIKSSIKEAERLAIKYVNKERAKQGKNKLKFNKALYKASKECSKVHADQKKFSNNELKERTKKFGYGSLYVEENCTSVPNETNPEQLAKKLVENWMKNRSYRANMLNSSFKDTGVGIWIDGDTVYSSQVFGKGSAKTSRLINLLNYLRARLGLLLLIATAIF